MIQFIIAICTVAFVLFVVLRKKKDSDSSSGNTIYVEDGTAVEDTPVDYYELDMEALRKFFKFPNEIQIILSGVEDFLREHSSTFRQYPLPVKPYPFTFAVRQQESGGPGREFGIMHPDALDTDLETQLEWFLWTLLKDTIRWNTGKLWGGWKKEDFRDFIAYFAAKYAPVGAENDPRGLNRFWENNVRYYYELFSKKGGE